MENSKTYQYRKVMKPMLERKRRARINKCLDDLKDLMVECLTQEGEHIVRLEKADILELTVDYLKKIKEKKTTPMQTAEERCPESFRRGYVHAANEVSKVLASTRGVDIRLGTTLMTHLGYKLNQIQSVELSGTPLLPSLSPTPLSSQPQVNPTLGVMTPLKIELDNYSYSSEYPLSPASSGYHSELESPIATEEVFSTSDNRKETNLVWRPW